MTKRYEAHRRSTANCSRTVATRTWHACQPSRPASARTFPSRETTRSRRLRITGNIEYCLADRLRKEHQIVLFAAHGMQSIAASGGIVGRLRRREKFILLSLLVFAGFACFTTTAKGQAEAAQA